MIESISAWNEASMMLGETPTVDQRSPSSSSLSIKHARDRIGAAVEDTHLVVDELEIVDVALILAEVLAQRDVERIDRAVAFGGRDQRLAVDAHLDHRLGHGDEIADAR